MTVFIDTSAFLAVLDADDVHHTQANAEWMHILESGDAIVTSNYVLVESFALVQNRLGMEAVRTLQEDIMPLIETYWVDELLHGSAMSALLAAARRNLSLVDCTSFEVMRQLGIRRAFVFDRHFKEQGFDCRP
jgi:predicted nucleic acid-binding protein